MYPVVVSDRFVLLPAILVTLAALGCAPARETPSGGDASITNTGGQTPGSGGTRAGGSPGSTGTNAMGGAGGPNATDGSPTPPDAGPINPLTPGKSMSCDSPPLAVPTQHIEAECAFAPTTGNCAGIPGGQQGTQLQDNSTTVGYIEGGDALWYTDLTMDGADTLTLRYAKGVEGGNVEIRLDSATGPLLGTFTPTSTNGWTNWNTATTKLTATTGSHALYLVAAGATGGICNLDWIELSAAANAGASPPAIHINHLGFDAMGGKQAVVEGAAGLARFHVVGSDGVAYWCGDLTGGVFADWGSSKTFYTADFTERLTVS